MITPISNKINIKISVNLFNIKNCDLVDVIVCSHIMLNFINMVCCNIYEY